MSFSDYLAGLAEVPLSWPKATLKAQAIAARSYAMDAYRRGVGDADERGYHICATDQCQVYRGATVELGAFGDRWVDAIRSTRDRMLTYSGRVIQAFYFSTSDGRTRSAFPGGSPQPWLPSVDGKDQGAPLGDWTAPVRLKDMTAILTRRGVWASSDAIRRVTDRGDDVRIVGTQTAQTMSKRDLRIHLNIEGPCMFPERYPNPTGSQAGGRLPQTVPSSSYDVSTSGRRAIFRGAGWGHFVGMSQWGAKMLGDDGMSARRILKHYYGPAKLRTVEEPGGIRVLAADDLRKVRISVDGPVRVTTGTGSSLAPGDAFTVKRGNPPEILRGAGPKLKGILAVTTSPRRLQLDPDEDTARITFETNRDVRLTAHLLDTDGTELVAMPEESFERGEHDIGVPLFDDGAPLPPGRYRIELRASDGLDEVVARAVRVSIGEPEPEPTPTYTARPGASSRAVPVAIALAALLGVGIIVARFLARR